MQKLKSLDDKQQVIRALEKNFLDKLTYFASKLKGMELKKIDNIYLSNTNLKSDTFNTAIGGNVNENNFKQYAKEVRDYYVRRKLPMAWWCGPTTGIGKDHPILLDLGFINEEFDVCMAVNLDNLPSEIYSINNDLDIQEAVSTQQVEDFSHALASVFEPFDHNVLKYYKKASSEMSKASNKMKLYIGYYQNKPVTSGCCFFNEDTAGIYDIATKPNARGKGFGSAMTYHTLMEAKKAGYNTAVLGASEDGLNIYKRLGFKEFGLFYVYSNKNLI